MPRRPSGSYANISLALVDAYPSLRPQASSFTHNDGRTVNLLQADGTIPIVFGNVVYNIPASIWLLERYPLSPPSVFLNPTRDMPPRPRPYPSTKLRIFLLLLLLFSSSSYVLFLSPILLVHLRSGRRMTQLRCIAAMLLIRYWKRYMPILQRFASRGRWRLRALFATQAELRRRARAHPWEFAGCWRRRGPRAAAAAGANEYRCS
ncbi:hypothetical protein HPP92_022661 [Vanilla planifolia]|uniref:UEV domain-containing protein n=1 Tax=Vanilla planifolia TaxID=51239 RepID=A0A835PQ22_VANPL|nr:hypothetical protein HPP92_022661 [Vanilla planifolia]